MISFTAKINCSRSLFSVLYPMEMRTAFCAISGLTERAASIGRTFFFEEHAEPAETKIPRSERHRVMISAGTFLKLACIIHGENVWVLNVRVLLVLFGTAALDISAGILAEGIIEHSGIRHNASMRNRDNSPARSNFC